MPNPLPPLGYEAPSKTDWRDTTFQAGVYVTGAFDPVTGDPITTADPAEALRDPLTGDPLLAVDVLGDEHTAATDNDHAARIGALARELGTDPQNPPRGIKYNPDGSVMVDATDDPVTYTSVAARLADLTSNVVPSGDIDERISGAVQSAADYADSGDTNHVNAASPHAMYMPASVQPTAGAAVDIARASTLEVPAGRWLWWLHDPPWTAGLGYVQGDPAFNVSGVAWGEPPP